MDSTMENETDTLVDVCGYCGHDIFLGFVIDHLECLEQLTSRPDWAGLIYS
jgi:hypothetical protein